MIFCQIFSTDIQKKSKERQSNYKSNQNFLLKVNSIYKRILDYKKRAIFAINSYGFSNTPSGAPDLKNKSIGISDFLQTNAI